MNVNAIKWCDHNSKSSSILNKDLRLPENKSGYKTRNAFNSDRSKVFLPTLTNSPWSIYNQQSKINFERSLSNSKSPSKLNINFPKRVPLNRKTSINFFKNNNEIQYLRQTKRDSLPPSKKKKDGMI